MGSLLRTGRAEQERNPLRPEVIGKALVPRDRVRVTTETRCASCSGASSAARWHVDARLLWRRSSQELRRCAACSRSAWRCRPSKVRATTIEALRHRLRLGLPRLRFPGLRATTRPGRHRASLGARCGTLGLPTAGTGAGLTRPRQRWPAGARGGGPGVARPDRSAAIDPHLMELIRRLAFLGSHPVGLDPGPSTRGSRATTRLRPRHRISARSARHAAWPARD